MGPRRAALLVAGAFLAFAGWEATQHVWFMHLPMATYHLLSLTVDLVLVLLIALAALAIVRRHTRPQARRQASQEAITTALAEDLRPHLLAVLTQLRALQSSQAEEVGEHTRELARKAEARAGVLLDMVEDLVAMSADMHGPSSRCAAVSLAEIAAQAVEALRTEAQAKSVELHADVPQALVQSCRAPDAMLRALLRLLRHALDSSPPGGRIEVKTSPDQGGRAVALSVTHTGERLLEGPADLEEVIARHGRLGLREVQALADALGGEVRYQPAPAGNTFTLSFSQPEAGG